MLYHVSHIVPRTLHMKLHLILITFYEMGTIIIPIFK